MLEGALKPRIGLLCTIGDWYRIYCGTDLIPLVQDDYEKAKMIISEMGELVDPGIIETVEEALAAGKMFKDQSVDILISVQLTWTSEESILTVWDQIPETPLVLFLTQGVKGIPDNLDLDMFRRNWGVNGNVQLTSSLKRVRPHKQFGHMVGHLEDEHARAELGTWVKAVTLLKDMRGRKSYYLPSNCPKFYGIWPNEAELVRLFGLDIQFLTPKVMVDALKNVEYDEVILEMASFYSKYLVDSPVKKEEIEIEIKNYLALKLVCESKSLSMITVQPWPELVKETGSFGLVALSLLVNNHGYAANDEGDMNTTISQWILYRLSGGKSVQMFENLGFDLEKNLIFGGHDGFGPPSLAAGPAKVVENMSGKSIHGSNIAFEFIIEPGPVTILGLGYNREGYFLRVTKGLALEGPCRKIHMPHALICLERSSVGDYFSHLHEVGGGHHYSLVHGDYTLELNRVGKLLNIPVYQL